MEPIARMTLTVPEAAVLFGTSRDHAYACVLAGDDHSAAFIGARSGSAALTHRRLGVELWFEEPNRGSIAT